MLDRLVFAALGGIFGAVLGLLLWWLYGLGQSVRLLTPIQPGAAPWVMYSAATFAFLGFVLKSAVADLLGDTLSAIYKSETEPDPWWVIVVAIALAAVAIWYLATHVWAQ